MPTSAPNYTSRVEANPPRPGARVHRLDVPASAAGSRLDQVLAQLLPQHSRNRMKAWIEAGLVRVDAAIVTAARHRLAGGEALVVAEGDGVSDSTVEPEAIGLPIAFEDDAILVIDKPAGLVVHPGSGNRSGTLQNALLHHAPSLAALPRAGIVHRLDKDTSGLMVVAKSPEAQTSLVRQLAARTVGREYAALVHGDIARASTVDAPIGRHPAQRTTMAVVASGKEARTHVEPVERFGDATLVHCRLDTGRTHQIRVHLTAIGHPLLGDPTYGGRRRHALDSLPALQAFRRQALHAQRLGLVHPVSGEAMRFRSPLPADFAGLLAALRARG